ncbi:MAG TPA: gamma carbonic anhydrase family protein [Mycobacteriales bacterium]|nr:gamma carbonic anhydrase family protein [Mycobacteriales bacterium]
MPIYALGERVPDIHPTAFVHPDAVIIGSVVLGEEANIWPGAVLRADYGTVSVGARTSIQDGTVIHADLASVIGADCIVGHNVHLHDCVVEDGCLIGSMSAVLNGTTVRSKATVAAKALVASGMEVPSGSTAIGVPARIRDGALPPELIKAAVDIYRDNAKRYRTDLKRLDLS